MLQARPACGQKLPPTGTSLPSAEPSPRQIGPGLSLLTEIEVTITTADLNSRGTVLLGTAVKLTIVMLNLALLKAILVPLQGIIEYHIPSLPVILSLLIVTGRSIEIMFELSDLHP